MKERLTQLSGEQSEFLFKSGRKFSTNLSQKASKTPVMITAGINTSALMHRVDQPAYCKLNIEGKIKLQFVKK